jgi:trimethylamine--corrinoid protein Co-methyltransferase
MLREQEFKGLHHATLHVLETVGLHIPGEEILTTLQNRGFPVDREAQTVKFPPDWVEEAVMRAPKEIRLYHPASEQFVTLGEETHFMPSGTGIAVFDSATGERRESKAVDVEAFVKLQEDLGAVDIARPVVTAAEFGQESDLVECYLTLRHTRKPFLHRTLSVENVSPLIKMGARVMGGTKTLREKPCFLVVYCPKSPLSFTPENVACMLAFAKGGIPVLVLSMCMGGVSAPATLWGQVLMVNAEVLGGITLLQKIYPGTPVLYGSVSSVFDMKTAILALGAPERGILNGVCGEVARRYGIPSVLGGLSTDSKELDEQAGFEKALTLLPLMGKASVVYGMGVMDSANTYSLEQLIIDDEMISAIRRVHEGVLPNMLTEELPLVEEIGWSGNYMISDHTLRHYLEYWRPALMTRKSFDQWAVNKKTLVERTKEKAAHLLNNAPPLVLKEDLEKELREILAEHRITVPAG